MSNTPGAIIVIAPIEAPDGASFAPFDDSQMSGGSHAVVDAAARDALPAHLLKPGTVATLPSGSQFVWNGTAWIAPAGGGAVTSVAGRIGDVVLSTADISGLGNSATRNVGTVAGTVAAGDDARLADARVPLAHTHPVSDLAGLSSQVLVGRHAGGVGAGQEVAVDGGLEFQGANLRRSALTGDVTASAGSGVTTIAPLAVTDAKVAAANKDGLAATPSMRTLGTGAQQAAAGNDARFTDARTPTAHAASHSSVGGDPISPASIGAEVAGAAASAVLAHAGAADPHGDRAFATAAVAAVTPASIGAEVAGATATHAALTTAHGESAFNATLKTSANAPAARTVLGLPASATRTITHSSSPPSGGVAGDIHFQIP